MSFNATATLLDWIQTANLTELLVIVLVSAFLGVIVARILKSRLLGFLSFLVSAAFLLYFSPDLGTVVFVFLLNLAAVIVLKLVWMLRRKKYRKGSKWRSNY